MSAWCGELDTALKLRIPVFQPGTGPSQKIEELESYMLLTAYQAGELNEARFNLLAELRPLEDEWDALEGWQPFLRVKTDSGVHAAKAQLRPDLGAKLKDLRWKVTRLTEEIDRLERDATKASRAYTMIAGS